MRVYYDDKDVAIYHGDSREVLLDLPRADLLIADPPYDLWATLAPHVAVHPADVVAAFTSFQHRHHVEAALGRPRVEIGDARDVRLQQGPEELGALHHVGPSRLVANAARVQPDHAAVRQERAGRVRHHQVPAVPDHVDHVALIVGAGDLGGQQVAGHRVMAAGDERIPNPAAVLAGDEDPHRASPMNARSASSTTAIGCIACACHAYDPRPERP